MAELFEKDTDTVGLHIRNLYKEGELSWKATTEEFSVAQNEGGRQYLFGLENSDDMKLKNRRNCSNGLFCMPFDFQILSAAFVFTKSLAYLETSTNGKFLKIP